MTDILGDKMDHVMPVLKLEKHPFFIGPITPNKVADLPESLPLSLGIHPRYAIPRVIVSNKLKTALAKAYSIGSMASTPLGESTLSSIRMNELLDKLIPLFDGDIKGLRFLELGCGGGALLYELKKRGAIVTGVEIGPQGMQAAEKFGIRIIDRPFKKGLFKEKFDCIYSYGCLEHLIDLDDVFEASRNCLNENGLFFHVVPNSSLYFDSFDLCHLCHQHINYFTSYNGVNLLNSQSFCFAKSALSSAGNELALWGYYDNTAKPRWPVEFVSEEEEKLKVYADKVTVKTARVLAALNKIIDRGQTIGMYAGGFEYGIQLDSNKIRYFDGDNYKHGKAWLKNMPVIESPLALKSTPVDVLIICKSHYYRAIEKTLDEMGVSQSTMIFNIETLEAEIPV